MELIAGLSKLKTLVNTSLVFNKDVYDQERLVEMQGIIKDLVTTYSTNLTENEIQRYFFSDVGYSPGEIAQKETFEEAGLDVVPKQLLKVVDKAKHDYPQSLEYVYKFFILCQADSEKVSTGIETSDVAFFTEAEVEQLAISVQRNRLADLKELFAFYRNPWQTTQFD